MNISERDKRMLMILAGALAVFALLEFVILPDNGPSTAGATQVSSPQLRQRLTLLRQTAATLPVRESLSKQTDSDLTDRERGVIQADTSAQAQATLVEIARRVGKLSQLDVRSNDFPPPKTFGDYGLVYATVTFDCHIEQLLNFLADLTRESALIVPSEEHITSGNAKEKLMSVRMVLSGVVPKKLIPEKKGLGQF